MSQTTRAHSKDAHPRALRARPLPIAVLGRSAASARRGRGKATLLLSGLFAAGSALLGGAGCGDDGAGGNGAGSGSVKVQISGEELATDGFSFPEGSEVTITDGWRIELRHALVTVGRAWLSENPDTSPSDQSRTGPVVAEVKGPWAVDLAQEGEEPGAGGEGTAILLTTIEKQNQNGDAALAAGERYGFSYDFVPASDGAKHVNFEGDAETRALYDEMADKGYVVYLVGTATFEGTACQTSDDTYDFAAKLPDTLEFKLGFTTPAEYLNCQNQENQGEPFDGEEYQRGVTIKDNEASLAQMTVHMDHPFYSTVEHEPALYFDQLAALLVGAPAGEPLTLEHAAGVDPSAFADAQGTPLPWRACDGSEVPATKQRFFDTGSVPLDPAGSPSKALRDYRDFVHYVQSTQGHMNGGEGICFTKRNYPSPP